MVDLNVLKLVQVVSMGIGVLPNMKEDDGIDDEIMYMTTKFERIVGREAFNMTNSNGA